MSATHRAMIVTGDRWLEDAEAQYREGVDYGRAAAAAAISAAYYARAADERPDTFAELIRLSSQAQNKPGAPATTTRLDEAVARHPAGGVGNVDPPPRPIRDNPQA